MGNESLLFGVGGKLLSLPLRDIEEIVPYRKPVEVPSKSGVKGGFFTHRGRAIPVFEIYPLISDGAVGIGGDRKIIIIKYKDREIGIAVDEVLDIIEENPEVEAPADENLFDAVGNFGEKTVLFLNEERLMEKISGGVA